MREKRKLSIQEALKVLNGKKVLREGKLHETTPAIDYHDPDDPTKSTWEYLADYIDANPEKCSGMDTHLDQFIRNFIGQDPDDQDVIYVDDLDAGDDDYKVMLSRLVDAFEAECDYKFDEQLKAIITQIFDDVLNYQDASYDLEDYYEDSVYSY